MSLQTSKIFDEQMKIFFYEIQELSDPSIDSNGTTNFHLSCKLTL